jgi:hypothetical protein
VLISVTRGWASVACARKEPRVGRGALLRAFLGCTFASLARGDTVSGFPKCVHEYDKHWRGVCGQIDTPGVHAGGMARQGSPGRAPVVLKRPGTTPGEAASNWGALDLPAAPDTTCLQSPKFCG